MKKLLNWWDSLDEVEKASTETISRLIQRSEAIIADERIAWVSTAHKPGEGILDDHHGRRDDVGDDGNMMTVRGIGTGQPKPKDHASVF